MSFKKAKKTLASTLALALVTAPITPFAVLADTSASSTQSVKIDRLGGSDRFDTAVEISKKGWSSADTVVLASGNDESLVDALTVAPLARAKSAPILLTGSNELNSGTKAEIQRLGAKTVYVASGAEVIPDSILQELKSAGIVVIRLGGADRYKTSVTIAEELAKETSFKSAIVANAYANADALSAAPIAASEGVPILLTDKDTIPTEVRDLIASKGVTATTVIGSTGVISDTVKNEFPSAERIGGIDRFDTNKEVLKAYQNSVKSDTIYIANGNDEHLVDSLAGTALASEVGSEIVFSDQKTIPIGTVRFIDSNQAVNHAVILGGTGAVEDYVVDSLAPTIALTTDTSTQQTVSENAVITGSNTTIQNVAFSKNVVIKGSGVKLKNVTIAGITYVDIDTKDGMTVQSTTSGNAVIFDGLTAKGLVIQSGDVNLVNTTADSLHVESRGQVAITASGSTSILSTTFASDAKIMINGATLGAVTTDAQKSISLDLVGTFTSDIVVNGSAIVTAEQGAVIPTLTISDKALQSDNVTLVGAFTAVTSNSKAGINVGDNSSVATLATNQASNIVVAPTATVATLTPATGTLVSGGGKVNGTATTSTPSAPATNTTSSGTSIGTGSGSRSYAPTFTPATDSSTANTAAVLGVAGTTATSDNTSVATADLTTVSGYVTIKSVSAGTANITITDGAVGSTPATIPVTVAANGTITLGTITKYAAPVTVTGVNVVDGADGVTAVTTPIVGQVLRANIALSDGTTIGTYPVNPNATYKWYYKESPDTVLGTTSSYTVTSDNAGKTITCGVTVTGEGSATWTAAGVIAAAPAPVTVTGVNVVDGADGVTAVTTPIVGQVLRANIALSDGTTIGTYPVNPNATYKWYYKESPDTVLGTTSSYTVTSDNAGKIITCGVTVTGEGSATWTAAGVIAAAPAPVTVTGVNVVDGADGVTAVTTPIVGQVLRANIALSDGTTIGTYPVNPNATYKWYYKESPDTVLGTTSSYTVTSDNVGKTITCGVTVTGEGVATWTAAGVIAAAPAPVMVTGVNVVDGADGVTAVTTPIVGQVLRANIALSDGTTIGTYPVNPNATYKWYYKESPDTVLGTTSSYTVTSDNVGKTITCGVTVTGEGSATWTAAGVIAAAPAPVMVTGVNVVDGADGVTAVTTPIVGQVLRANIALSDGTTIGTYPVNPNATYKWYYKESPDTVLGTTSSYTVTSDNAGKTITCGVTVTGEGSATWTAAGVIAAAPAPVTVTGVNVVDGADGVTAVTTPIIGQVLRANIAFSDGTTIGTYPVNPNATYKWYYKESPDTVLGTTSSYTVTSDNVGKTITCGVTVTGEGSATWTAAGVIAAAPAPVTVTGVNVVDGVDGVTAVTTPIIGQVLRANIAFSDGTTIGTYPVNPNATYKWYYKESPDTVLGTTSSYTVTSDNVGKTITCDVKVTGEGSATWTAAGVIAPKVDYFTGIDFSRSNIPLVGTSPDGRIVNEGVTTNGAIAITVGAPVNGYVDAGFVLKVGALGQLSSINIQGSGEYGLNLYFDLNKDGEFFSWNNDGTFNGLGGDTYALYQDQHDSQVKITDSSNFFSMSEGKVYTLAELKAKYGSDIQMGIWIGVTKGTNEVVTSKNAVINSVFVNNQPFLN